MTPYPKRRRIPAVADRQIRARGKAAPTAQRGSTKANAQASRLAAALLALTRGLPNPWDESTDYFHSFVAAMPPSVDLAPDSFRKALGIAARYQIDLSSADDALRELGDAKEWGEDTAAAFQQLTVVMRATLGDRTLAFARGKGVVRVRVWLFGRTESGTLVGLRSISTET